MTTTKTMIGITNNDDDDKRIPNIKFPAVMACGYRRIEIPKSGNFFPAFLIALPIIQPVQVQAQIPVPLINNINQDEQRQQQNKTIRFVWRSKRDFLILARSLSSSTNNRQLSLPKAALKKIVQDNIIPWRRTRTSCCSSSTKTKTTEDEEEENNDNSNSNNNNNIPYFLCDPKLPNKFCPQMKKSLWQLDRFLQMFYTETIAITTTSTSTNNCNSNNNAKTHAHAHAYTQEQQRQQQIDKMKLAWEIFCRPYDTEGLITPKEFFPSTTTTSNDTNNNTNTTTRQEEIQKQKQQVVDEQNSINITKTTKTTTTATSLEESCKLGQYFASKENSKRVVDCALEKIIPLYHEYNNRHQQQQQSHNNDSNNSSSSSSSNNNNNVQILFIEPSCGHGDIVVALVDALKKRKTIIPPQSVYIQGYDIDPNAITTCRQRQEFLSPSATTTTTSSSDDDDDDYHIHWECRNFLETTRQQYIEKFDEAAAAINNNDNDDSNIFNISNNDDNDNNNNKRFIADTCTDATRNNNRNININNDNNGDETLKFLVCCLGGPPYTTGPGHGSKIQRDLPTQFVRHCQEEWNADVITFILPTRYREGMQHNISDCTFTTARTKTKRTTTMTEDPAIKTAAVTTTSPSSTTTTTTTTFSRDCCTNNNWICDTKELNASTFFFRGSTQVTQPSIIQNFYMNRGNERTNEMLR